MKSKAERLEIFKRSLLRAKSAASLSEALQQIAEILNRIEDRHSGIPFDPEHWMSDGRLYPPQHDAERLVPDHPNVRRFRSRQHNTFIGNNGAIEIQDLTGEVLLAKRGENRKGVWNQ